MPPACRHTPVQVDVSSHAVEAGFTRPPLNVRHRATTKSGRVTGPEINETLFPGPLVLPDDGLAIDPKELPQSFRSWSQEKWRNPVTQERRTLYVVPFPGVSPETSTVQTWAIPALSKRGSSKQPKFDTPEVEDVRKYLEAFYYSMPVKLFPDEVRFVPWVEESKPVPGRSKSKNSKEHEYIGLQLGNSVTRITTRPCPDKAFARQLCLTDLLDAAITALPADAYAIILLVAHDTYEDEEDDFCCGRAYGGSRVCVVSSARYNPLLDGPTHADIDRKHMWPASHCKQFVERLCREAAEADEQEVSPAKTSNKRRKLTKQPSSPSPSETALQQIITASLHPPPSPKTPRALTGLWLSRLARTASHELGHCLCLAHCPYYACVMQTTGSVREDVRQPPYLCLVCLAKVTAAIRNIGNTSEVVDETMWMVERYGALLQFCREWEGEVGMFAGFGAWLGKRTAELEPRAALFRVAQDNGFARFGG